MERYSSGSPISAVRVGAITDPTGAVFTFERMVVRPYVKILTDTCPDLYIAWNAATASATSCDDRITATDKFACTPEEICAKTLTIFGAGAATQGTVYIVKGW